MVDLTEEIMAIKGVSEILWVFAGFGDSDMKSMEESFFVLWKVLDKVYRNIESKTGIELSTETEPSGQDEKIVQLLDEFTKKVRNPGKK